MFLFLAIGLAFVALAHTAPAPFVLDAMAGDTAVWHMPAGTPPTVYLTFDDGPNPSTTPQLLDALAREHVQATFFLIDRHITEETAPIVRRMFADGHSIGLHTATRAAMLWSPDELARNLEAAAEHIRGIGGMAPCRAFRPHAGWGWMLWDFNWFRARTADATVARLASRASAGDILVMHDGDESAPRKPQPQTVEAAARLIPALRARGFTFGTVCRNGG